MLLSSEDLAYISGFFDGNGHIVTYLKKNKKKIKISITISFRQSKNYNFVLYYIKEKLNSGYISNLKNGVTELRINGLTRILKVSNYLIDFLIVKKKQIEILLSLINLLLSKSIDKMSKHDKLLIIDNILLIQSFNSITKQIQNRNFLIAAFNIPIVTTL
ncbi:Homing endonuclease [uncultured bacterium]|nr:Homing endonuclease [uncultured bacterium]